MPLLAQMPYERAVDMARSAKALPQADRDRVLAYLAGWAPELVATAMEDLRLGGRPGYGYDTHGLPVALELAP